MPPDSPHDNNDLQPGLELVCIGDPAQRPTIRPMAVERDWMDATPDRFAYRCLPLNIANAHGWEILCPGDVDAVWTGEDAIGSLKVVCREARQYPYAVSHFGSGILTFPLHALIRTPPGYDIWIGGPPNRPKDGIYPLSGVIETDWSPYGFTMNWRMTRIGHRVHFDKGEPIAAFFLIPRGLQERVEPRFEVTDLSQPVQQEHETWRTSRKDFIADLPVEGSDAQKAKWQKGYFQGRLPSGEKSGTDHRTQLRLKPFKDGAD